MKNLKLFKICPGMDIDIPDYDFITDGKYDIECFRIVGRAKGADCYKADRYGYNLDDDKEPQLIENGYILTETDILNYAKWHMPDKRFDKVVFYDEC